MLFRIEGTGVKIAGATASSPVDTPPVPRWLRHVFGDADRLVFATDSELIDPAAFRLPAHQSLTVLSFFDAVSALWKRLEMPESPARFKPWAVSSRLGAALAGLLAPGAEPVLLAEAKSRSSRCLFFESPQERMAAFDAVPLEAQLEQLEQVVNQPGQAAAFDRAFHEAWTAYNLKAMEALLDERRRTQPQFCQHCLDARNQRWLPRLTQIIGDDDTVKRGLGTLVVVEAWHLCASQGLVALLTGDGHRLTRLL